MASANAIILLEDRNFYNPRSRKLCELCLMSTFEVKILRCSNSDDTIIIICFFLLYILFYVSNLYLLYRSYYNFGNKMFKMDNI